MKILDFNEWRRENSGTYGDYLAYARPLEQVQDELDSITSTLPGTVFRSEDGLQALFLGHDETYVIWVSASKSGEGRAFADEAYLIPEPLEDMIEASRDMLSDEIMKAKGFGRGWTC